MMSCHRVFSFAVHIVMERPIVPSLFKQMPLTWIFIREIKRAKATKNGQNKPERNVNKLKKEK